MTEASTNASSETVAGAPSGEAVSIRAVEPEGPLVDVMNGSARWEIPVLDHGFVALVDVMPRLIPEGKTADSAIVQAARVSYSVQLETISSRLRARPPAQAPARACQPRCHRVVRLPSSEAAGLP